MDKKVPQTIRASVSPPHAHLNGHSLKRGLPLQVGLHSILLSVLQQNISSFLPLLNLVASKNHFSGVVPVVMLAVLNFFIYRSISRATATHNNISSTHRRWNNWNSCKTTNGQLGKHSLMFSNRWKCNQRNGILGGIFDCFAFLPIPSLPGMQILIWSSHHSEPSRASWRLTLP